MTATEIIRRYGDRPSDADAWLRAPSELQVYVDFRSPETPAGQWHRVMTVTASWLSYRAAESNRGAYFPVLLIVPDGTRSDVDASITRILQQSWSLIVRDAILLPADYQPPEW